MNGIELSRRYFFEVGLPLLQKAYPDLCGHMAAGLVAGGFDSGCGSEIGGFDDEISKDHNWGPRFFLFLSEEDKAKVGKEVQHYLDEHLPAEFFGFKLTATTLPLHRAYVVTPWENLQSVLQIDSVPDNDRDWLALPEYLLFEYTTGPIFYEPVPLVTPLRQKFSYYPDDVWFKKLSFVFFCLHAAGNAGRMAKRGDIVATQMYVTWLLEGVMKVCFLLRRRYAPYCKWLFRALKDLPALPSGLVEKIEYLAKGINPDMVEEKMMELLDFVGTMVNESGLIEPVPLRKKSSFVWTDFNCYGFMEAFERKLQGPLKGKPYEGPLDLYVTNYMSLTTHVMKAAVDKMC